ncbi:hypothetical protein RhiirA4_466957 [Rhizophagus irregularis]|uniref:Uncharacterized protein n=1 Tax=Rhizophagus irregularis TaxID=588596 RepID=A0A2I1GV99_9GLOM|nr:hypothetical protein RhiirA4_466957 [Rhizophagus irregularis]
MRSKAFIDGCLKRNQIQLVPQSQKKVRPKHQRVQVNNRLRRGVEEDGVKSR